MEDDDIVDLPNERAGLPKVVVALGVIAVLFIVLVLGGRSWYQRQLDPPGPPGEEVDVLVPNGARLTDLGSLLSGADVISNATVFRFWIRDKDIDLQAGTYRFRRSSSFEEAAEVLRGRPLAPATLDVTVPEGLRLEQIVDTIAEKIPRFSRDAIIGAINDPANRPEILPEDQPSMEGMLFPSTYEVGALDTPATLVARMVDEMGRQTRAAGLDNGLTGDNLPNLSAYEVLVVASLIERETAGPEESPKIARVIYNRLLDGMPLQIDATSQFLADETGEPFDLESPSPYNTRINPGLPPTPIAAPSRASIDAALHPATGPWLYYVLVEEGAHLFTDDYDEFLAGRDECAAQGLGCG